MTKDQIKNAPTTTPTNTPRTRLATTRKSATTTSRTQRPTTRSRTKPLNTSHSSSTPTPANAHSANATRRCQDATVAPLRGPPVPEARYLLCVPMETALASAGSVGLRRNRSCVWGHTARPDASDDSESELGGTVPVAWNRHSKAESADCDDDGVRRELGDGERRSNVGQSLQAASPRPIFQLPGSPPVICLPAETETASGDRIAQGLQGRSLLSDKGRFNTAEGSANQNPRRLLEALQRDQSVRKDP